MTDEDHADPRGPAPASENPAPQRDPVEAERERLRGLEPPDEPRARARWRPVLLRLAISLALLTVLFWRLPDVTVADVVPEITGATVAWLAVAVGLMLVAYVLQNVRWWSVSRTLGLTSPFVRMLSHLLAAEFVAKALPTSFGGDVVRVVRQGRDTGDYADAFAATGLERLTGWLVLPLISAVALATDPDLLGLGSASTVAVAINVVTVLALVAILWTAGHERGAGRLLGSSGWRRYLAAVHLGIVAFRHRPIRIGEVLGAGLAFQVIQCAAVWCTAQALGLEELSLLAVLAFFPPTAIAQNVPFALSGLGVREAAFVLFFGAVGVGDADAIALGLVVYLVFVAASLAGAPSFAFGRRRDARPDAGRAET